MLLSASTSPHKRAKHTTKSIMLDVCIALLPTAVMGCVYFGVSALITLLISVFSCVSTEIVWRLISKEKFLDILRAFDFTSLVTGLILGLCLNSSCEWYAVVFASIFAIGVVKMLFGGTGKNIVNPAAAGRVFAFIAFQAVLTSGYVLPNFAPDGITTGATPLASLTAPELAPWQLFLGIGVAGTIGETCKCAILLGYIYLAVKKVIDWKLPLVTLATCGLIQVFFHGFDFGVFLPAILSGGIFFGAVFMGTDYVTSPKTAFGRIIYAVILGLVTALLRESTGIEVVSFALLLCNFLVPLLDRITRPKPFGYQKPVKEVK